MLKFSPSRRTALVLIDLQEGILSFAGCPYSAADVVKRAVVLAHGFRDEYTPVFLVCVGWSADFADALNSRWIAPAVARCRPTGGTFQQPYSRKTATF